MRCVCCSSASYWYTCAQHMYKSATSAGRSRENKNVCQRIRLCMCVFIHVYMTHSPYIIQYTQNVYIYIIHTHTHAHITQNRDATMKKENGRLAIWHLPARKICLDMSDQSFCRTRHWSLNSKYVWKIFLIMYIMCIKRILLEIKLIIYTFFSKSFSIKPFVKF